MSAKKRYDEKRMPFLEHLEELRWHIFRMIASVFGLSIIAYFFSTELVDFFTRPYPKELITLGPADAFMIRMKLAFFVGIVASLPVILREFWAFVAPGLLEQERKYIPLIVGLTFFCFLVGASFAFFIILPLTIQFLMSFQTEKMVQMVSMDKYLGFVTGMLLGFGLVFEMPMLAALLTRIGIISSEFLRKYRGYSIVGIFVIAAVITPSTDATTQIALAGPMMILYEVSIYVSKLIQRKRKEREEKEESEYSEELRQEAKARQKAASAGVQSAGEAEVKKWETEGDHYTVPETKPVQPDAPIYDDLYPYNDTPKSPNVQSESSPDTIDTNPENPPLEQNPGKGEGTVDEDSQKQDISGTNKSTGDNKNEPLPPGGSKPNMDGNPYGNDPDETNKII